MANKRFKDPIYGYIEIDASLIMQVVDTAEFQRLRDVIQTSYSPLYSSAVHNRFAHSIGVYYLGKMAAEAFHESIRAKSLQVPENISQYIEVFELACLLHDVGHAPFSHTGEQFYLYKGERVRLHKTLIQLTGDAQLEKEISDNAYKAAPHELVSAIVSLNIFCDALPDAMKSFFVRCITGYKFTQSVDMDRSCMNCLIELLNSKIIDVDKMDYLIRDSYMSGFDTVTIDYVRLLQSICVEEEYGRYKICFDKAAVSVIENVVYAHDAERKWIQNHPSVLYEAYLIENIMQQLIERMLKKENLTTEFQAVFQGEESRLVVIEQEFAELKKYLSTLGLPFIINRQALEAGQAEIRRIEKKIENETGEELERLRATLNTNQSHIAWIKIFERFAICNEDKLDFDFLILYANQFNSGFRKQEFGNIEIIFPELKRPCKFREVSNVLTAEKSKGERFFFIYYNRKTTEETLSIAGLIDDLLTLSTNRAVGNRLI